MELKSKVARNAMGMNASLDSLIADLDKGKYDKLAWMPKEVKGGAFPQKMVFDGGFSYNDEDKVRAAWRSGKFTSVHLYLHDRPRGEIAINAAQDIKFTDMSGKTIHTGDVVEWFRGKYKIVGLSSRGLGGGNSHDTATLKDDGGHTMEKPTSEIKLLNSAVACNGVGDMFADAAYYCKEALWYLTHNKPEQAKAYLYDANRTAMQAISYDSARKEDIANMRKAIDLIKKAIAAPTEATIKAAQNELEKARKSADEWQFKALRNATSAKFHKGDIIAKENAPDVKYRILRTDFARYGIYPHIVRYTVEPIDGGAPIKIFEPEGVIKVNSTTCNASIPAGATPLRVAYDVDGRPIKVGDKVTATAGASFKEDVIAAIFKDGDKGIFVTLKGSPQAVRDPRTEIMKNSCALKTKVAQNAMGLKADLDSTASNTRTLPVSKQAWTDCELKGIEVMKKYLYANGGNLPKTNAEVDAALSIIPAIDAAEKQNVMSYFKYGKGKSLIAKNAMGKNAKDEYLGEKLKLFIKHGAISTAAGGRPGDSDIVFDYRGKRYYVGRDSAHMVKQFADAGLIKVANAVAPNAKFKVGDKVEYTTFGTTRIGIVREVSDKFHSSGPTQHEGEYTYIVDFGRRPYSKVWESYMRAANAAISSKVACNAMGLNDKWIDDFHAILTEGKPDPALVEALKKKAAALKAAKRSPADNEAKSALAKAEEEAMAITKRLGAKWIQQGAVYKIVMPDYAKNPFTMNAIAKNWNYKNKYQFFCVDPSLAKPCIHSGWDYKEDAKEDAQELKELKIPYKIVSRRFLEQSGIDPNNGDWWKKGR